MQVGDMDAMEQSAHGAVNRDHKRNVTGSKEWYYAPASGQAQLDFLLKVELAVTHNFIKAYQGPAR
jgi:hypothetical protein